MSPKREAYASVRCGRKMQMGPAKFQRRARAAPARGSSCIHTPRRGGRFFFLLAVLWFRF